MKMRLCLGNSCENLTWSGSYYDGVKDNNPAILNHYTVVEWSPQAIRLESRSVAPLKVEEQVIYGSIKRRKEIFGQGVFTGMIGAESNSIENGKLSWQAGQLKGESTFTLTWEAEPSPSAALGACPGGRTNPPLPVVLLVCDGPCLKNSDRGDLGTWIFSNSTGNGDWGRGAKAYLTLQEWSEGRVTITREDKADSLYPGFSAVYRGTVCGEKVKGMESAEWPGHWQGKISGPWTADIPVTRVCSHYLRASTISAK